jgi:hypothetical protein
VAQEAGTRSVGGPCGPGAVVIAASWQGWSGRWGIRRCSGGFAGAVLFFICWHTALAREGQADGMGELRHGQAHREYHQFSLAAAK